MLEAHKILGAQLSEHNGTLAPENYTTIEAEYAAVRKHAAFFDLSHFGKLRVSGKDALDLIDRISTNDLTGLTPGMGKQTFLATEKGRIVDLCTVWAQQKNLLLLTSPANSANVKKWIEKFVISDDVTVEDVTELFPMLLLAGTSAAEFLSHVVQPGHKTFLDLSKMPRHNFIGAFLKTGEAFLARTNMVMNDGYIIFANRSDDESVWNLLLEHSKTYGATPAGQETFEIMRIENGTPLYPYELNEEVNPWETNISDAINDHKGCYVGQEVIARLQTYEKVKRRLVGLSSTSKMPHGSKVYSDPSLGGNETEVGLITSSTRSPGLDKEIALAYISLKHLIPGSKYIVRIGEKNVEAKLSILPFLI